MGSKQVQPKYYLPPDLGGIRNQQIGFFDQLFQAQRGGQNPFYAGYGDFGPGVNPQMGNFLFNQGTGTGGAMGAAGNTLQQAVETGLPIDATPLVQEARQGFARHIAPEIQEQLGARYGLKFGTPVAESLARAGGDVQTRLNAELTRYSDLASQRRLAATGMTFDVAEMERQGRQQALFQLLNALVAGPQQLYGQGQWMMPGYQQSGFGQAANMAGALGGAFLGGPGGAALGGYLTNRLTSGGYGGGGGGGYDPTRFIP